MKGAGLQYESGLDSKSGPSYLPSFFKGVQINKQINTNILIFLITNDFKLCIKGGKLRGSRIAIWELPWFYLQLLLSTKTSIQAKFWYPMYLNSITKITLMLTQRFSFCIKCGKLEGSRITNMRAALILFTTSALR